MPLLSFVVPIYNAQEYLDKCLTSILYQTMSDFEVILVNDGSSDNSGKVCDFYARYDRRFRVIHQSNKGLSEARNVGIAASLGEWITFLDSDDYVEPGFAEELMNNQVADYIVTSYSKFREVGSYTKELFDEQSFSSITPIVFSDSNLKVGFFTAWGKFFRLSVIKKNKLLFVKGVSPGEDTIFVFEYLCYVTKMYISPRLCYNWRECNGLTNRKRKFNFMLYTIDLTILSIEKLEQLRNVELKKIKFNNIIYLLDRIDMSSASLLEIRDSLKLLYSKTWMTDVINDNVQIKKGKRRRLLDILLKLQSFLIMSIYCKFTGRLYS